jgi:hypothetical protein
LVNKHGVGLTLEQSKGLGWWEINTQHAARCRTAQQAFMVNCELKKLYLKFIGQEPAIA